jgi:hypothetical protein
MTVDELEEEARLLAEINDAEPTPCDQLADVATDYGDSPP